jgi:hypothetical protein
MANQEFLGEFLSLPTEAQNQVVSLIAYLKQKYIYKEVLTSLGNITSSWTWRRASLTMGCTRSFCTLLLYLYNV